MLHSGAGVSEVEQEMATIVRTTLADIGFSCLAATDLLGTGDFLSKIIDLIRGCGFGVAIYSDQTPSKTLGNIFFEIGVSHLLGKPVQLLLAGDNPTPSDFVRTEWLLHDPADRNTSITKLRDGFLAIEAQAEQFFTLGELVLDAEIVDYELAFERFKQAVLISNHPAARSRIVEISEQLRRPPAAGAATSHHQQRLRSTISHFLRFARER